MTCRTCILALLLASLSAIAGDLLTVRLVHASYETGATDNALADIEPALRNQLPLTFKSYRMLDKRQIRLPAKTEQVLVNKLILRCEGPRQALRVMVDRQEDGATREVLHTTLSLEDGKPLVIGGFPGEDGRLLLVFLVGKVASQP